MTARGAGDDEPRDPDEGFLSRWSRRKREVAIEEPAPPAPGAPATAADQEPDDRPRDPETGEPIDEDLVKQLPAIAQIKPGDDLSMFMRKGVPEALRREALRTMWVSDPAIRDFVGPALDYAYDYNAPGGAPGYGPLSQADIAQARDFIEKLFSRSPDPTESDVLATVDVDRDNKSQSGADPLREAVPVTDVAVRKAQPDDIASPSLNVAESGADRGQAPGNHEHDTVQRGIGGSPDAAHRLPANTRKRRGGGATPA